jgi:peptide-methionine (S)-S-oxide reductase
LRTFVRQQEESRDRPQKFDTMLVIASMLEDQISRQKLIEEGNDVGTQYRSVIFYHDEKQKELAEKSKKELEKEGVYKDPIVTEITPFKNFYVAEDYHKNYYEEHQDAPYCDFVIDPKIRKLLQQYGNDVKDEYK